MHSIIPSPPIPHHRIADLPKNDRALILDALSACYVGFEGPHDERLERHSPVFHIVSDSDDQIGVFALNWNGLLNTIAVLYVVPRYRRRGYAKTMIGYLKVIYDNLHVTVTEGQESTNELLFFYESVGFLPVEEKITYSHGLTYVDFVWTPDNRKPFGKNGEILLTP